MVFNDIDQMNLIAHRGGAGLRVENTIAAFGNAIDLGADGAELDVQLTSDGQVVVHHDAQLNIHYCRWADDAWITKEEALSISGLTWADLQRYEIGTPKPDGVYAAKFDRIQPVAGQRIPLLRDVIALAKVRSEHFFLVIEIKTQILDAARKPWRKLVDAVLEIIEGEEFANRSILCSFDWGALIYAKRCRPDLAMWFTSSPLSWLDGGDPPEEDLPPGIRYLEAMHREYDKGDAPWFAGFDPRRFADGYPEAIAAAGGDAWFMYWRDCTPERVRDSSSRGLLAAAWSVNLRDRSALARLMRSGADAVCLDYIDVDLSALSPGG